MMLSEQKVCLWEGYNKIFEDEVARDVYGCELNVYKGRYQMFKCSFDVMIRKGSNLKMESYNLLRKFHHDIAIELLDFYTDDKKNGCLVIPQVDTMFKIWLQNEGKLMLFSQSGHMTPLLKKLIIEYYSLVEKLIRKNLIIEKFDMDNMYISLEVLQLRILLTEVKQVKLRSIADEKKNWSQIREFASWCAKHCCIKMDALSESFCNYIGKSYCKFERLKDYPDDWDPLKKGEYLLTLVGADHGDISNALNDANINWPYEKDGKTLPVLLQKVIDWEDNVNQRLHNTLSPMSYINLLRNLYKHHDGLPEEIKAVLVDRKAIIKVIEQWSPGIWIRVYERIGWP